MTKKVTELLEALNKKHEGKQVLIFTSKGLEELFDAYYL